MVIAAGSSLQGSLEAAADVRVDGAVHGALTSRGSVTVSASGEVGANIRAQSAHLAGKVVGDLDVTDLAELSASAVLEGSIRAGRVVIAEGARLTGTITVRARKR